MALRGVEEAARTPREGLKVTMEPIPGTTNPDLLGRNGIFLQTAPLDNFPVEYGHSHNDYTTVREGQFSRKAGRNLRSTSFDTLVVDYATWAFYNGVDIEDVTAKLIEICESGEPVLLTAAHDLPNLGYENWNQTAAGPELQWPATLRSLRVEERAGEGDSRYTNMSFTEYRDPDVSRFAQGRQGGKLPAVVTLYMDGSADDDHGRKIGTPPAEPVTLHLLARFYYGDPSKWGAIARSNGIKNWSGSDALIYYPGYRSMLPKGGKRVPLPPDASKFQKVRVAKIKVPKDPKALPSRRRAWGR